MASNHKATTYEGDHDTTLLVHTVDNKKSKYTSHLYSQAHKIQNMIGHPSTQDFLKIMERHLLPNCPITQANILAVEDIFGPNVDLLKGKMLQCTAAHVVSTITPVPADVLSLY